jgi:hypothetical protein
VRLPVSDDGFDLVGSNVRTGRVDAEAECHPDELDEHRSVEHHEYPGRAAGRTLR